ncbi:hypothetical protein H9X85_02435 [Anaerotignum lactatifermentans]|uniref:Uncharacterized protein n=1 Tax=Anaerotignum lactatifermentans TaxID=160404 RepID=A0ABS2GBI1_9FIRM|nr:hypothetical protein [Anaerotignum lactatifermentans]MBM6828491.1 hypothetical protein [Anaerotignum lactatifermentans]MBM6877898.1 hypothetical protein [Anaerotignum lactatifermentans]MBM6950073.1 hypothetical protein [Anaerotignum lactatifermentans]
MTEGSNICPCMGCAADRYPGCHVSCGRYRGWKDQRRLERREKKEKMLEGWEADARKRYAIRQGQRRKRI